MKRKRYILKEAKVTDPTGAIGPEWMIIDSQTSDGAVMAEVLDKEFAAYLQRILE
jgi:hypothetical protein